MTKHWTATSLIVKLRSLPLASYNCSILGYWKMECEMPLCYILLGKFLWSEKPTCSTNLNSLAGCGPLKMPVREPCSIYIDDIVWSFHQWIQGELWPVVWFWCSLKTLVIGWRQHLWYLQHHRESFLEQEQALAMAMACKVKRSDLYLQVYMQYAFACKHC